MAVVTIGRLSEEIQRLLSGGDVQAAANVSLNELKIAIGQVANQLLKLDYFKINARIGETIPNGAALGLYEAVAVSKWHNKSAATLPIKPLSLPRGMGVFAIFPHGKPDQEFIPLQMGQSGLLRSQPMINELLGQVGYEVYGNQVVFTRDLTGAGPYTVDMRLAVMDIAQYGDYDILPLTPEHEWQIKQEVLKLYSAEGITDKLVDPSNKQQQNIPVRQQQQS